MRPATFTRLPSLSWLSSRANTRGRLAAVLTFPVSFAMVLVFWIRRGLFESRDRHGMVIVHRYTGVVTESIYTGMGVVGVLVVMVVGCSALLRALGGPVELGLGLASAVLLIGSLLLLRGSQTGDIVGEETPAGERWLVAALAQRPGTHLSALLLARSVLRTLPAGSVLVAAAIDDRVLRFYEKLGFTAGPKRRVHMVLPG